MTHVFDESNAKADAGKYVSPRVRHRIMSAPRIKESMPLQR